MDRLRHPQRDLATPCVDLGTEPGWRRHRATLTVDLRGPDRVVRDVLAARPASDDDRHLGDEVHDRFHEHDRAGREETRVAAMANPGQWAGGFTAWISDAGYTASAWATSDGRMFRVPGDELGNWVRQVFPLAKGFVAGCLVTEGKINRNAAARLRRGKETVHEGKIATLKRFKDDANEVRAGLECGIKLDDFNGYQPGDVIECFEVQKVRASL